MDRRGLGCRRRLAPFLAPLSLLLCLSGAGEAGAGLTTTAKLTLLRNQEYAAALLESIRSAKSSIVFSFYLFKATNTPGNLPGKIVDELIAARKRGVDVTVYLEKKAGKDPLIADNRRTAELLLRGGVRVLFDSPNVTSHAKAGIIDRRFVFLGSHNLTDGALRRNNELSVLIDSPELAAEIRSYLDRL
ncbi:phospholipase D-like domain-containing protein [Geobacter sp. DSM 9736]|uniref:phospholipase D-like domain-containing protein n=1 Tax=Geobacter sp. DSM 9736 TaxID=1277350 RepID=UPI000B501689|nr:phospholipase D-like domain-containing protein [Geobacter sp. DSM 9736]SNB47208.1 PLD-like domain-containing protein [Geobacter sp. DSM 9736]